MGDRSALGSSSRASELRWRDRAPLCPAGHLPHLGGDQMSRRLSPIADVAGSSGAPKLPISPLVGEMPGEGGAKE
ncbi:hypothetical protein EOA27_31070 [Mesorhizobium sp. M2A.F.Ca.ET.037.01.1.1]|nr:hypothetical protein EJ072_25890 [Mesorhizobium sp. M2A.F.Ca.ET.046.03.2.1]RUX03441.1 hypothetical protein EOA27_31070 [Mesorhizobium sp. M2A.F.Ca.ET.037.01.1.1]RUX90949.1 hypothetical protein EOA25_32795 [Mesorhizobium sp. M2A.F.Ca.ET.040.01.1.1]RVC66611.1 hypothetical protein EN759_18295 [Mesorhizobium sp. M00.F.Ca.ET.038.03.1.1]RVC66841.1 hypothetical protein EN766_32515 [Mesorhizobium sp. M2A.F.Ca.ET.046.02.1.1]RWA78165.1 MAG: hypothetical protein EOQ31_35575 [Mesorhizobium sp.]RWX6598